LACTRISSEKGVYTIVKIVILSGTQASEVEEACLRLRDIDAFIVLQPASGVQEPKSIDLIHFHERHPGIWALNKVAVIPQAHKLIGVM